MVKNIVMKMELTDFNNLLRNVNGVFGSDGHIPLPGGEVSGDPAGNEECNFSSLLRDGLDNLGVDGKKDREDDDRSNLDAMSVPGATEIGFHKEKISDGAVKWIQAEVVADKQAAGTGKDNKIDAGVSGAFLVPAGVPFVAESVSGVTARKDGVAASRLLAVGGAFDKQGEGIDGRASTSSLDLPSGRIGSEAVQDKVSAYPDAKVAPYAGRGNFAAKTVLRESVSLTAPADSAPADAVLPQGSVPQEAVSPKISGLHYFQEQVGSSGIIGGGVWTEVNSPVTKAQKVKGSLPREEVVGKAVYGTTADANFADVRESDVHTRVKAAGDAVFEVVTRELGKGAGSSAVQSSAGDKGAEPVSGVSARKDGGAVARLSVVGGALDKQAAGSDWRAFTSSLDLPSGRIGSEAVQEKVSANPDAKVALYSERGNFATKTVLRESTSLTAPTDSAPIDSASADRALANVVLPQDSVPQEAVSPKISGLHYFQEQAVSMGIIGGRVWTEANSPAMKAQKVRGSLPQEESTDKTVAGATADANFADVRESDVHPRVKAVGDAVFEVITRELGKGAGSSAVQLSVGDKGAESVSGVTARKDGAAASRSLSIGAAFDKQGEGSDWRAFTSSLDLPSGRIGSEAVQEKVSANPDAKAALYAERGNFAYKAVLRESTSLTAPADRDTAYRVSAGRASADVVLPQGSALAETVSPKISGLHYFQEQAVSMGIIGGGVWTEAILSAATKAQKIKGSLAPEEAAGRTFGSTVADINSYNVGSRVLNVDAPVPVEGHKLAEQIASQLPEVALKGSNRVRINLHPESLGNVDMDIVVSKDRVHVFIIAERADVVHALQGQQEQLKNALHSQGLQVSSLDFQLRENPASMDDGSRGGDLWRHQNQDGGQREGKNQEDPVTFERLRVLTDGVMQNQHIERTISLFV